MNAQMLPLRSKKRSRASSTWIILSVTMCAALPVTIGTALLRGNPSRRHATSAATNLYNSLSDCAGCSFPKASGNAQETGFGAAVLRENVGRRLPTSLAVTSLDNSLSDCRGCTSSQTLKILKEVASAVAVLRGTANQPRARSTTTNMYSSLGDCPDCMSFEALTHAEETTSEAARPRGNASRGLATSTVTSLYNTSDCTDCTSSEASDDAQETATVVATASSSATATISRSSVVSVSASASSSATATFIPPGTDDGSGDSEDDGDDDAEEEENGDDDDEKNEDTYDVDDIDDGGGDDEEDGEKEQTTSSIEVLSPTDGDVLCPETEVEVAWTGVDGETADFHVDLHDCGQDACCVDCGEFVRALCDEEGCTSGADNIVSVDMPQDMDDMGPYFKIVVSVDDGSTDRGCSGTFIVSGDADASSDDTYSDVSTTTSVGEYDDSSVGDLSTAESDNDDLIVLESCDSFDAIPYPLLDDMEVYAGAGFGVTELTCTTPKTVHLSGGTLKIVMEGEEAVVFSGIRFELESVAVLLFIGDTAAEFTGMDNLRIHGGILSVAEGANVDIGGPVTFHNNSVQATAYGPCYGAAIYNEGSIRLRGSAVFSENFVSTSDGHEVGDGGAVWNGPTGRIVVESTAILRSNGVEEGGCGGALWNEGIFEFQGSTEFALNMATSNGDEDNLAGIGGGIFNHDGLVRFKGNATFVGNYAQGGAALANSGGAKVVFHADTTIVGNISNEEEDGVSGAVWNREDGVVRSMSSISFVGNRGYNAGAMLNEGRAIFQAGLSVRENSAVMNGGGFINESGARMVFYDGAEFVANIGTGSGGAILNRAELVFRAVNGEGSSSILTFQDNYSGEDECKDIQNESGSEVSGLHGVDNLCEIGTQEILG